ncbi:phage tail protein [Aurantiacibacter sp. MUD61]|uniref:phage tail protein n=1 Tax=Aurantiacibacter sp. MUD61 TaxID=3009083 RepID=UPI0022F09447|nr:tail fiber protein [Aurantiacibacter sp. MUD61]
MKTKFILAVSALATAAATTMATPAPASAQEQYLGEVRMFGTNWCPRGFAQANGTLLPISQYTALFSLLGTTFGGDGRTTFALPDLRSRAPIGYGSSPGNTNYQLGIPAGREQVTLTVQQMPSHNHQAGIQTVAAPGDTTSPQSDAFAQTPGTNTYSDQTPSGNFMHAQTVVVQNNGGNQPFSVVQPVLPMNYCIATTGIFPSRN